MKFGIEKCAVLVLKRGRLAQSEGITLPGENTIKAMGENEGYKYLGVLEADGMLHHQMKDKIGKEYLRILTFRASIDSRVLLAPEGTTLSFITK